MKRVFIIHGYGGSPEGNWFPWLKAELDKKGFKAEALAMPNTDSPFVDDWLQFMLEHIHEPDEDTYLIGHSLGAPAILRYLEAQPADVQVGGAVLVAGFAKPIRLHELDSFVKEPFDFEKIKQTAKQITLIHSDNDPYVPLSQGEYMEKELEATLIIMPGHKHLNEESGYTKLPVVLEELLQMAK